MVIYGTVEYLYNRHINTLVPVAAHSKVCLYLVIDCILSDCDRPPRHRFFLVSLCLKVNAEMVPKIPSCHYMLLM